MDPIRLELTLDLNKHIHDGFRQISEDDYTPEKATVESLVLDLAAQHLVGLARHDRDLSKDIRERVGHIRDEEIRAKVAPLVAQALEAPIRKTNSYGDPTGPETNLRDLILTEVQAAVKQMMTVKGDSYNRNPRSALQELIHTEVGAAFQKEVKATMDAAKAEVIAAVRAKGAELLASTVKDLAGRL